MARLSETEGILYQAYVSVTFVEIRGLQEPQLTSLCPQVHLVVEAVVEVEQALGLVPFSLMDSGFAT